MPYIMVGMDQKDSFVAPQLQFVTVVWYACRAGFFLFRSCSSSSGRGAEFIPWSRQFVRNGIPQLLHRVIDVPVYRSCKSCVPCLLSCTTDARGSDSADSVEVPQVQFLRCGGRLCSCRDEIQLSVMTAGMRS